MTVINLPQNFIGPEDQQRLESFGGHLIANGKATRWHWSQQENVDVCFQIFRGGADEELLAAIGRDREHDRFFARDAAGDTLVEGALDHVMAVIDERAAGLKGGGGPAA